MKKMFERIFFQNVILEIENYFNNFKILLDLSKHIWLNANIGLAKARNIFVPIREINDKKTGEKPRQIRK